MTTAAYLYSILEKDGITRRDLPNGSAAQTLAPLAASVEFEALFERIRSSGTKLLLLKTLKAPQPDQPSLIPSSDGDILSLLLTIPLYTLNREVGAIYETLFSSLPATTEIVCLVNSGSKAEVEALLAHSGRVATLVEAPDHVAFSLWAQDGYAVATTVNGDTYFIEPLSFLRYADALVADYVVGATDLKNFQVPLYFQGGNILVGDTFWLIGIDYPTNTLRYVNSAILPNSGEAPEALIRRLYGEHLDSTRDLIYVGSSVPVPEEDTVLVQENGNYYVDVVFQGNHAGTAQPLFHIDMFMTLAGRDGAKYRVLVGDPSLGPSAPGSSLGPSYSMKNVYDSIAASLIADGRFAVTRNPLPLTYIEEEVPLEKLDRPGYAKMYAIFLKLKKLKKKTVSIRRWYFATANNALVEIGSTSKAVWLPTYGHDAFAYLQASDDANAKIWSDWGFTVNRLPSFHRLARGLGAVHCIQKYLARG